MPGYHAVIAGGEPIDGDGTMILASERPCDYKLYHGEEPFDYFPSLPVDSYATTGSWNGSIDDLYGKLDKEFSRYFIAFVYRSYDTPADHMLDMYYPGSCLWFSRRILRSRRTRRGRSRATGITARGCGFSTIPPMRLPTAPMGSRIAKVTCLFPFAVAYASE